MDQTDDMPLKREGEMILPTLMLLTHLQLQCLRLVPSAGHRLLTAAAFSLVLTSDPGPLLVLTLTSLVHQMTFSLLVIIILALQRQQLLLLFTVTVTTVVTNPFNSVCTQLINTNSAHAIIKHSVDPNSQYFHHYD